MGSPRSFDLLLPGHLRYLFAAAEHRSFRQAARSLSVEPSTISLCVRDLEDQVGAALFVRESGGVRLTVAGEVFVKRVRKAFIQITYAVRDVGDFGRSRTGVVRIRLMSSIASGFIAELVNAFAIDHDRVSIV